RGIRECVGVIRECAGIDRGVERVEATGDGCEEIGARDQAENTQAVGDDCFTAVDRVYCRWDRLFDDRDRQVACDIARASGRRADSRYCVYIFESPCSAVPCPPGLRVCLIRTAYRVWRYVSRVGPGSVGALAEIRGGVAG